MKIENKTLFNLYQTIKTRYFSRIVIEGQIGKITLFATDGIIVYRKIIQCDNQKEFTLFFDKWTEKTGTVDTDTLESQDLNNDFYPKMKEFFNQKTFNEFSVNYKDWKQAIKGVDVINKGEKYHDLIISLHNGDLDLASWNYSGSVSWQIEGKFKGNGAVCVNKKYLDLIKTDFSLGYCKIKNDIVLYIKGDIDIIIKTKPIEQKEFQEVLNYEYNVPEVPLRLVKPKKVPRIDSSWIPNKLGTRYVKVCNW